MEMCFSFCQVAQFSMQSYINSINEKKTDSYLELVLTVSSLRQVENAVFGGERRETTQHKHVGGECGREVKT